MKELLIVLLLSSSAARAQADGEVLFSQPNQKTPSSTRNKATESPLSEYPTSPAPIVKRSTKIWWIASKRPAPLTTERSVDQFKKNWLAQIKNSESRVAARPSTKPTRIWWISVKPARRTTTTSNPVVHHSEAVATTQPAGLDVPIDPSGTDSKNKTSGTLAFSEQENADEQVAASEDLPEGATISATDGLDQVEEIVAATSQSPVFHVTDANEAPPEDQTTVSPAAANEWERVTEFPTTTAQMDESTEIIADTEENATSTESGSFSSSGAGSSEEATESPTTMANQLQSAESDDELSTMRDAHDSTDPTTVIAVSGASEVVQDATEPSDEPRGADEASGPAAQQNSVDWSGTTSSDVSQVYAADAETDARTDDTDHPLLPEVVRPVEDEHYIDLADATVEHALPHCPSYIDAFCVTIRLDEEFKCLCLGSVPVTTRDDASTFCRNFSASAPMKLVSFNSGHDLQLIGLTFSVVCPDCRMWTAATCDRRIVRGDLDAPPNLFSFSLFDYFWNSPWDQPVERSFYCYDKFQPDDCRPGDHLMLSTTDEFCLEEVQSSRHMAAHALCV